MTEAEILELIGQARASLIGLMQWWASVSFALIALAHFGRKSLNLFLVSVTLLLYVAFSLFAYSAFIDQVNIVVRLTGDLAATVGGDEISGTSEYVSRTASAPFFTPGRVALYLAMLGTCLATIGFVLYAYFSHRRIGTAS